MERFCRGCLIRYDEPAELLEYTEKNRRLFVYCTGIQVKRNDTFTFQLCKDCYLNMKQACKFKKLCRTSDKKFKTYMSLKEIGDAIDWCTYLKNNDDMLRFPTFAANSTPRTQKNKDAIEDLDESTCTSIGNFMTDILQGEEMPDTEARIIRQVIEEEADILEDSLDSHWLQDDASIDTDFRLDFSFSPFSTPRSVTNDHYYTPSRLCTPSKLPNEGQHKYIELSKIDVHKLKEMSKVHKESSQETNIIIEDKSQFTHKQIGTELETERINTNLGKAMLNVPKEFNQETNTIIVYENQLTQKQISAALENVQVVTNLEKSFEFPSDFNQDINIGNRNLKQKQIGTDSQSDQIDINLVKTLNHDQVKGEVDMFDTNGMVDKHHNIEDNLIILRVDTARDEKVTKVNSKNYYVDKLHLAESVTVDKFGDSFLNANQKEMPQIELNQPVVITDSIDKNLQNALKTNNDKFALEDLLASPAVLPSADVLSTPSIHNLIFGDMTDKENYNKVNIERNISGEKSNAVVVDNKIENSGVFKERSDEYKNSKLGSVSSIEKILFGDKLDEDDTNKKQYSAGDEILENKIDEANAKFDAIEKIIFDDKFEDSKIEIEGSYIEALDEFFNLRDIKQEPYSKSESCDLINNSGTRYDYKACQELYDFKECYCKLCKKKYKNLTSLRIHSAKIHKIMLKKKKYISYRVCEICGATIKDARNFTRHMDIHRVRENLQKIEFKCELCGLSFKQQHHLAKHKLRHRRAEIDAKKKIQKNILCPDCGMCVSSIATLKAHQKKHTMDFLFHCTECGKGFYSKYNLVAHMRLHTGEQPYKCTYCPKAFRRSSTRNKHVLIHSGTEKFECDYCHRSFNQKESIIIHIMKKLCPVLRKRKKKILEKYECQFCHHIVSGLSGLQAHQRLSRNCHIQKYQLVPLS